MKHIPYNSLTYSIRRLYGYKNYLLATLIILFIISSSLLIYSYRLQSFKTYTRNTRYAEIHASIDPVYRVKPTLLYNYEEEIHTSKTYYSLAKSLEIRLTYNYMIYNDTNHGEAREIKFYTKFYADISTDKWSIEYLINETRTGCNKYVLSIDFNTLNKLVERIDSEINTRSYIVNYIIRSNVLIAVTYDDGTSRIYELKPVLKITIDHEKNSVSISSSNTDSTYSKRYTVKDLVYTPVLGASVLGLRSTSFYLTIIVTTILALFLLTYTREYKVRDPIREVKTRAVKSRIISYGDKPIVEIDLNALNRIIKQYKLPLFYDDEKDVLFTTYNGIFYILYIMKNKPQDNA
jgi:hypothetical protein